MSPPPGGREGAAASGDAFAPGMRRRRCPRGVAPCAGARGGGFRGVLRCRGGSRSSIVSRFCDGVAGPGPAAGASVSARGAVERENEVGTGRRLRGEQGAVGEDEQAPIEQFAHLGGHQLRKTRLPRGPLVALWPQDVPRPDRGPRCQPGTIWVDLYEGLRYGKRWQSCLYVA
jgi:hypothetical protein